ncbi:MAG: protein kinase [bacterium]|nr:protein kinase [Myxococcales bacterium]
MTVPLGAFDLLTPIASGGMGQVWRGSHRQSGTPVAIKVLTGQITQQPRFREAFRNEARSMSGLDHPGIVRIFDYGEISSGSPAAGQFGVGCPYLVMEYVDSALSQGIRISSWPVLKEVLLALLDALAHAHARGVIHRDLKPSNILVDASYTLKISDFGIAFALEADGVDVEQLRAAGTPEFMAPEQCHGLWRDFGPWTDLYALGCVAYTLITGGPPFQGDTPMNTMLAKLEQDIPPLRARFALPVGFEVWIRRMLQRAPGHRFQRAADAAWSLRGLSLDGETHRRITTGPIEMPAVQGGDTLSWFAEDTAVSGAFDPMNGGGAPATYSLEPNFEGISTASLRATRAPIPVDWRSRAATVERPALLDVGLGLYGLRRTPLVDREEICDQLWRHLRLVHTAAEPRVVLLRGPAGAGKSRIVEWLCERSHELGAGTYLHARHAPDPGPAHGLGAMLLRHLRCTGLSRMELRDRLQGLLSAQGVDDADEWEALTQLLAPAGERSPAERSTSERHIRFFSLIERHLVLMRQLDRMAHDRALILWLDDVQFGYESLEFVARVLERGEGGLLIVMTAREEDLSDRPIEDRLLEEILQHEKVDLAEVGPLAPEHHRTLVRGLLALEPGLAHQVESRTAGNPHFAIQLVRDWVQRGLLEPGPRGFRLAPGARVEVPADIREVWEQRVSQLLADRPQNDAVALELAAVLGQEVDEREWIALCRLARVEIDDEFLEVLLRDRLIRPIDENDLDEGFTFAHAMLREALERHAADAGRLRAHHLLCAGMLRARGANGARLGRHLRAGGAFYAALEPLRRSVEAHLEGGDYQAAEAALIDWLDTLDGLDIPEVDRRWAEGHLLICRIASLRGDLDEADEQAAAAEAEATTYGWDDLAVQALVYRSGIALDQGRFGEGAELADAAAAMLDDTADLALLGQCMWNLGRLHSAMGRFDVAAEALLRAEAAFRALGDDVKAAHTVLYQARVALSRQQPGEAAALVEAARAELHAHGSRTGVADAVHDLGELARLSGDLGAAEELYREARELYETIGSAHVIYAELNLSMVLLARGAFIEAKLLVERVLEAAQAQGRQVIAAAAHVLMLPCVARARDWRAWDSHFKAARGMLTELELVDGDIALHARMAAELAAEQGQASRAVGAMQLALDHWQALGRADEAASAREALRKLARVGGGRPAG